MPTAETDERSVVSVALGPDHQIERDADIARSMTQAVRRLNDIMDAAIKAGLIVEPSFCTAQNRFDDLGITAQSYTANVKVFRKLC
ncbi:MAG: hypothetical protein RIM84_07565 [Alphaproteobacteria bacterium]